MYKARTFILAGVIFFAVIIVLLLSTPHFYFLRRIDPDEIGVQVKGGVITNVVPPGIYSDIGLFVRLETYSIEGIQFTTQDPEVITADNQRIGVTVSGTIFRPGLADLELIKQLWPKYRTIYTNREALQQVIDSMSLQAMKVCVGDRPFRDSVIGTNRDSLRKCIEEQQTILFQPYGLKVENVTVPNVTLSPEVQALLDSITKSRLETEKAAQDKLKAEAEGAAMQAQTEASIRVEQAKAQEEARQKTLLAKLEKDRLDAERGVIEAQKANALLAAQKDLEINRALALAAQEKALADLAKDQTMAEIYQKSPAYYQYQIALANAAALKPTDKIIFVAPGMLPQIVFGDSLTPVVPVTPVTPE